MEEKLREYAKLLIEVGLNVQKGQTLVISCPVDCAFFARLCASAAYDVGCREVYVEDFTERPDEVRFFLRTDADAYMFGSSLGKSLTVQYTGKEDIAPALREVRAYCKDAAETRDPCLIGAMAQASAAKSATAEGEAGGKKF